jgi:hypothetical protein
LSKFKSSSIFNTMASPSTTPVTRTYSSVTLLTIPRK